MKRHITLALAAAATVCAAAQDLQKEITVDRYVLPHTREASRLSGFAPRLFRAEVKTRRLDMADYNKAGEITNEAAQLPPAPWLDSIPPTPWRGYASLGYFPVSDFGASLGYRLYRDDRTDVGVWAQYIGNRYKGDTPVMEDARLGNDRISVGANGSYRIGRSVIGLEADYSHCGVVTPTRQIEMGYLIDDKYTQGADIANVKAGWTGYTGMFASHATAGFSYFGFGDDTTLAYAPVIPAISQTVFSLTAGTGLSDTQGGTPWIGIDADWDFVRCGGMQQHYSDLTYYDRSGYSLGHLRPYLNFGDDSSLSGRVGVNLSVATGNNHGHLRIAPDVEVNLRAAQWFSVYGKATGGEHINSIATLFDINPYISPEYGYERTNVAVQLEIGCHFTPINGLRLSAYGRYARVKDGLLPLVIVGSGNRLTSVFDRADTNGWLIGAEAEYSYRDIFSLGIHGAMAKSNNDFLSWHTWHDGAKYKTGAFVSVRPISSLKIKAAFDLAYKRKCAIIDRSGDATFTPALFSLGRITDLSVTATYDINSRLSAFITGENLLGKRWLMVGGMPDRGVHGLFGASCKF